MSFHKSQFGAFGNQLPCDVNGQVPERGDKPEDFTVFHGFGVTHDVNGNLTPYGQWWINKGFDEWVEKAVEATKLARQKIETWKDRNPGFFT